VIIFKLIQSLFKTLHSEGTPGQVAAGMALGAILGLTPLMNLHNLVIFALIMVLNASFGGAMIGWALFTPLGFALDPLFDAVGKKLLLDTPALTPLWTTLYNVPVVPLTNFNNTVTLGSLAVSVVAWLPLFFLLRWGVRRYRATMTEWMKRTGLYRWLTASKLYNVWRLFVPGS
jgi:uncharacterized protein (TIGR03546 family)